MPGAFDFTGAATSTRRPIYVGDTRELYLTVTDPVIDYSDGYTFRAEIARDRLPGTSQLATFDVTAPIPGALRLVLPAEESAALAPLLDPDEGTALFDDDGNPTGFASAVWDLEVTETATGRVTTLLSGKVKVQGDVSRA